MDGIIHEYRALHTRMRDTKDQWC